jgi:hypothetical protein
MKVCQIVCLILYILSYVLCYLIIGVCQLEHLHESLSDCVSYLVYDNAMAKRKKMKKIVYKPQHRKLKTEHANPT